MISYLNTYLLVSQGKALLGKTLVSFIYFAVSCKENVSELCFVKLGLDYSSVDLPQLWGGVGF